MVATQKGPAVWAVPILSLMWVCKPAAVVSTSPFWLKKQPVCWALCHQHAHCQSGTLLLTMIPLVRRSRMVFVKGLVRSVVGVLLLIWSVLQRGSVTVGP